MTRTDPLFPKKKSAFVAIWRESPRLQSVGIGKQARQEGGIRELRILKEETIHFLVRGNSLCHGEPRWKFSWHVNLAPCICIS